MDATIMMSGLIALVMQSRGAPATAPARAVMVPHHGHTAVLLVDLSSVVLDANTPPAHQVFQGPDASYGLWNFKEVSVVSTQKLSTIPDAKMKDEASVTDHLLDLSYAWGKEGVGGDADSLPHVKIENGRVTSTEVYQAKYKWKFCPAGTGGMADASSRACKEGKAAYASSILWRVNATGLVVDGKTLTFHKMASPKIWISNQPNDLTPNFFDTVVHFNAMYKHVLGEVDPSKVLLPYNSSLPKMPAPPLGGGSAPAKITNKPTNPERCPGAIVFRKP